MTTDFILEPLEILGERIELTLSYAAPHSELFAAIVARQLIEADPAEAISQGVVKTFDSVWADIKIYYLTGGASARERVLRDVESYLRTFPDEKVSSFVAFCRSTPPVVTTFNKADLKKVKADKKRKEKLAAKSKRRNRR